MALYFITSVCQTTHSTGLNLMTSYALNQWPRLATYCESGDLSISNAQRKMLSAHLQ